MYAHRAVRWLVVPAMRPRNTGFGGNDDSLSVRNACTAVVAKAAAAATGLDAFGKEGHLVQ